MLGFERAADAAKAVLDEVVSEIGNHYDTLSLRSIPENYVESVRTQIDWLDFLFSLLSVFNRAPCTFETLGTFLEETKTRLYIIVEDAERMVSEGPLFFGFIGKLMSQKNIYFIIPTSEAYMNQVENP